MKIKSLEKPDVPVVALELTAQEFKAIRSLIGGTYSSDAMSSFIAAGVFGVTVTKDEVAAYLQSMFDTLNNYKHRAGL